MAQDTAGDVEAPTIEEAFAMARQQLEERAASGDLAGAYDKWLRILYVEGERYRDAVSSRDHRAAAGAALGALGATELMIPVEPQNLPALKLLEALRDMILDAANGAKQHPILLNRAHLRGHSKGVTMERKRLQTLAVCCSKILVRRYRGDERDDYAPFLSEAFGARGQSIAPATIRSWVARARDEVFGDAVADGILSDPAMKELLGKVASRADAERFCHTLIDHYLGKSRVATAD